MLRILILLIALLGTVTSLICLSCDDVTKCSSPFTTNCPNTQVCYTVKKNEQVVVRGCAESCDHVPITPGSSCESCNQRDFCNGKEQGIGYNVDREHHRVVNGSVEITNDTVVDVKTISIKCLSCDSYFNCTNHIPVDCPNHSNCYTLTREGTEVLAKGCTHSCSSLTFRTLAYCKTCDHKDFCNGPSVAIGSSGFLSYWVPREYGIGVAVRVQSVACNAVITVWAVSFVFYYLL